MWLFWNLCYWRISARSAIANWWLDLLFPFGTLISSLLPSLFLSSQTGKEPERRLRTIIACRPPVLQASKIKAKFTARFRRFGAIILLSIMLAFSYFPEHEQTSMRFERNGMSSIFFSIYERGKKMGRELDASAKPARWFSRFLRWKIREAVDSLWALSHPFLFCVRFSLETHAQ